MCFQIRQVEVFPITKAELQREIKRDPEQRSLCTALFDGTDTVENIQKYSLHDGTIMSGVRVVISAALKGRVLQELHSSHMGVTKMKVLARSYCYWHANDFDIETLVKACKLCCLIQKNPTIQRRIHAWKYPKQPWERVYTSTMPGRLWSITSSFVTKATGSTAMVNSYGQQLRSTTDLWAIWVHS
jgi:Integrase zinc binding domain